VIHALTPRTKQIVKLVALALLIILVGVGWLLLSSWRRKTKTSGAPSDAIKETITNLALNVAATNNQAAIEVTAARTNDTAVKTELKSILADKDVTRRLERLVDLRKRVEVD